MPLPYTTREPRRLRRRRAGFTLVDLVLALAILVVAIGGLSMTVVSTSKLARTNEDSADAYAAIRQITEEMQGLAFDQVFPFYSANPDFPVQNLQAQPGDADGFVGRVNFPTVTVGGVVQLREDVNDAELGMPRDLNGDTIVDALDHSADYILLPVTITLDWFGADGNRTLEVSILLTEL